MFINFWYVAEQSENLTDQPIRKKNARTEFCFIPR